jgi:hypothetical protein
MVRVTFTQNLQRHVACPSVTVPAGTLREVLDAVFAANPRARSYVLEEQGAVRPHMSIFICGSQINDRTALSDPVPAGGEVYVLQALSGG